MMRVFQWDDNDLGLCESFTPHLLSKQSCPDATFSEDKSCFYAKMSKSRVQQYMEKHRLTPLFEVSG